MWFLSVDNKKNGLELNSFPSLFLILLPSLRVAIGYSAYLDQTILFALISMSDHTTFKMGGLRVNAPCSVLSSLACQCSVQSGPFGPWSSPLLAFPSGPSENLDCDLLCWLSSLKNCCSRSNTHRCTCTHFKMHTWLITISMPLCTTNVWASVFVRECMCLHWASCVWFLVPNSVSVCLCSVTAPTSETFSVTSLCDYYCKNHNFSILVYIE